MHLEHLEDEMFNGGYAKFTAALSSLGGVVDSLQSNNPSAYDISVKWDGSPSIFCGSDPETGKFFVATKSIFNATPKVNHTDADIDRNHPGGGVDSLNNKLKQALRWLKPLKITTVLQGDLLFLRDSLATETIDGKRYLTFQPNTIKYALDPKSDIAKRMLSAEIGIVFHTEYDGDTISSLRVKQFNPNLSGLTRSKKAWFDNATYRFSKGDGLFSAQEIKSVHQTIAMLVKQGSALKTVMNAVSGKVAVVNEIKTYFNSIVKTGRLLGDANELLAWATAKVEKERKARKTKVVGKVPTPTLDFIRTNRNQINHLFALHNKVSQLKRTVLSKLTTLSSEFGTFLKKGDKYVASVPEGFVAIDRLSNAAVKLVDRIEFSRANFTKSETR